MPTILNRVVFITIATAVLWLGAGVAPAHADMTAFVGMTTFTSRKTVGGAFSRCRGAVCPETEFAHTSEDATTGAPSISTFGVNLLVRFKSPAPRMNFYGTAGFGLYCEMGGRSTSGGGGGHRNLGGGAQIVLAGPVTLRLDYRLLLLGQPDDGKPFERRPQRMSAGLSLRF